MSREHDAEGIGSGMDRLLYWAGYITNEPKNSCPRDGYLPHHLEAVKAADANAIAEDHPRAPDWEPTPESREKARYAFNSQFLAADFAKAESKTVAMLCTAPTKGMDVKWEYSPMTSYACRACLPGEMRDGTITQVYGGNPTIVEVFAHQDKKNLCCTFLQYKPIAQVYDEMVFGPKFTSTPKNKDQQRLHEQMLKAQTKTDITWHGARTGRFHHKPQNKESLMRNLHGKLHNAIANITGRLFAEVANVVIDIQTGAIGITGPRGVLTCKATKTTAELVENPLSLFELAIPAYAIRTTLDKVELGDIVLHNSVPYFVTKAAKTSLGLTGADGGEITVKGIKNTLTGDGGVLLVKNIAGGSLQQLLPLLLLTQGEDGDEGKLSKLLMVLALQGGEGGLDLNLGGTNSLLPLMLLSGNGDRGSMKDMLPLLLLTQNKGEGDTGLLTNPLMLAALLG